MIKGRKYRVLKKWGEEIFNILGDYKGKRQPVFFKKYIPGVLMRSRWINCLSGWRCTTVGKGAP